MSKTPISILQEYMMKTNRSIPTYTYISHRDIGTNDHEFTIKVTSDDLSADGKGSTKKEAKQNAAKELLLLIGGTKLVKASVNNNKNNMTIVSRVENNPIEISDPSPTDMGINYIGLLHEHCSQKRINMPLFIDVNAWGPSHDMNFSVRCQVADIEEEAIAKTKKQAKTDAAKKVWFKLSNQKFDSSINKTVEEMGVEIKDLKLEDVLPDYKEMHEEAKGNYLKLTKLKTSTLISDKVILGECHRVFVSNFYSRSHRQSIITELDKINIEKEDVSLLPICKSVLKNVIILLKFKLDIIHFVHRESLHLKNSGDLQYTIGYKLYSEPILVSIFSAETSALAELKAIFNIAIDLKILLS